MSVEGIQPKYNVDCVQPRILETDSPTLEVGQNPCEYKFGCDPLNLQSTKPMRKAQIRIAKSEVDKQHQFERQYHRMMQKLEMEIQQMKFQLGDSLDIKENMDNVRGLTTESAYFKHRQSRQRNKNGAKFSPWESDYRNSSSYGGGGGYEDELLYGRFSGTSNIPGLGPQNFGQRDNGEILATKSGRVQSDLYKLYSPRSFRDNDEDVSFSYNNLAQFVNSFTTPWEEKMLEQQKFKAELYKTEMCRSWAKFGLCPYGESCRFAHGHGELRVKPKPHWKYKTEMCKKFLAGYCPYGSRCSFVHMPYEQQNRSLLNGPRSSAIIADPGKMTRPWPRNTISAKTRGAHDRLSRLQE
jgi:hypothetical protein